MNLRAIKFQKNTIAKVLNNFNDEKQNNSEQLLTSLSNRCLQGKIT